MFSGFIFVVTVCRNVTRYDHCFVTLVCIHSLNIVIEIASPSLCYRLLILSSDWTYSARDFYSFIFNRQTIRLYYRPVRPECRSRSSSSCRRVELATKRLADENRLREDDGRGAKSSLCPGPDVMGHHHRSCFLLFFVLFFFVFCESVSKENR